MSAQEHPTVFLFIHISSFIIHFKNLYLGWGAELTGPPKGAPALAEMKTFLHKITKLNVS